MREDTTFGIQIIGLYPNIPKSVERFNKATFIVHVRRPVPK